MARLATNGFEQWAASDPAAALAQLRALDARLAALEVALGGGVSVIASLGQVDSSLVLGLLVQAITSTSRLFASVMMHCSADGLPDFVRAHECAQLVLAINAATRSTGGEVVEGPLAGAPFCFKIAITCGLGAGSPFFPGAYAPPLGEDALRVSPAGSAWRTPAFAFACENSDLLVTAFSRARALADPGASPCARLSPQLGGTVLSAAKRELEKEFGDAVGQLEALGLRLERVCPGVTFAGTDSSVASAARPEDSLVVAFEAVGLGPFGGAGTLALCALVTGVLKQLPFRLVGYCGLMLPQTEDTGLAQLAARGALPISSLLLNSAVCGTGIDTVIVPAGASAEQLAALYCDVASMSARLKKPLSARVWPAAAAPNPLDPVLFSCPFFVDSAALPLDPPVAEGLR
ncbi:hypothetical protein T492DRAFT_1031690 [Pavlovales sp. CCMP2436]|nr:hypothetical protein T492DRAFT_1031690 [Pavlovales sp. CCMP2436]